MDLAKKDPVIPEEQIKKGVKSEMRVFNSLYFDKVILDRFDEVERTLNATLNFIIKNLTNSPSETPNLDVIICGIITRGVDFYKGALFGIGSNNLHVAQNSLRSLIETVALANYCLYKPDYMENACVGSREKGAKIKVISAVTLVDHLEKNHPESVSKFTDVKKTYDSLCDYVHPNPASIRANIEVTKLNKAQITFEFNTVSKKFTLKYKKQVFDLSFLLIQVLLLTLDKLVINPNQIKK